jgi:hypothetical protein
MIYQAIAEAFLWLFVINLGIAFGAGMYEWRITVPQWLIGSRELGYTWDRDAAVKANVGLRFWVYVTTVPLTSLTIVGLIMPLWLPNPVRAWWFSAASLSLLDRLMTFGYFIPTMIKLMRSNGRADPTVTEKALQWVRLGYVRHAAALAAWLAALRAFSLFYLQKG